MTYREAPRGYVSSLAVLGVLAVGYAIDASLGGARAHLLGWALAAAVLVGIDALVTYAARSTRSIAVTDEAVTVGDDVVPRADIVAVEPEVDATVPVLGMSLTRELPRRVAGLTLLLRDGGATVVPTRHPDRLARALGVAVSAPEVRPAAAADLPLLDEVEARADTVFRIGGYAIPDLEPLDAEARQVLVAGTPPFGFVRLDEVDGCAHIQALAVVPGRMRRGVGTALVEAACDWARAQGYPAVTLTTFADVPWNRPFYERLGFTVVDDVTPGVAARRLHEQPLEVAGPRVVMRRAL